jgi:YihY family inner membrane protein
VTSAKLVPVTKDMSGDELDAEDAWHTVRRHGFLRLVDDAWLRFRLGDGFTNARALALGMALSVVPFMIALTGLAADLDADKTARVIARTASELTPGSRSSDVLASALSPGSTSEGAGEFALAFGLVFALVSMTMAMAQIERGANRLYGIPRDRPGVEKYLRATVFTAVLALPVGLGFLLLVAGGPFGDAMQAEYGWSETAETAWDILRWPVGLVVTTLAIAVILDHAPRRHQPQLSWLALGSAVAVTLTMAASGLLSLYVKFSDSFGSVYGPLAGIIALLLWCQLTSLALFFGTAMAAQLEALRAGVPDPDAGDPGPATESREPAGGVRSPS